MATRTSKKVLLTGLLALSSAFILASCDKVTAVPANYDTPIVNKGTSAFKDDENKLGAIYDELVSNKNEKVTTALLEKIAEQEFGTYKEIKACFNKVDGKYVVNATKAKAHIAAHKHQFVEDDDSSFAKKGVTAEQLQLKRFEYFFEDLNERIDEIVYKEVKSYVKLDDTSNEDIENKIKFLEEKYARDKRKENYEIAGFNEDGTIKEGFSFKEVYIDSKFSLENVRDYLTDFETTYADYITKKLIPDVYKDKLVEEYILDNNYSALGRAYGRKVNFVKVDFPSDDPTTYYSLVNTFVKTNLDVASVEGNEVSYDVLVNWIKGFEGIETVKVGSEYEPKFKALSASAELTSIYGAPVKLTAKCEKLGAAFSTLPGCSDAELFGDLADFGIDYKSFKYYEKTKLGEILKDYQKAVVGGVTRFASDEDNDKYKEFTNTYKQPIKQGLIQKILKLALEDYADDGWYVKNDSAESINLPDAIKTKLFNIKVANDFDNKDWVYDPVKSYFKEVRGHYYLSNTSDATYNFILKEDNALYIVEVLEAPSTSKLLKDSDKSYTASGDVFKCEEVARHIAKILGTKDTYTTNAYTSYLKLYVFTYHDTAVYEYLKDTYPNLFEDE